MEQKKAFGRTDIIVICLIVSAILASFIVYRVITSSREDGVYVVIYIDGDEISRYSLKEDIQYDIVSRYGHNKLVIEDGKASIEDADCPDEICAHHIAISKNGEEIACIPHKLIIRIEGDSDE